VLEDHHHHFVTPHQHVTLAAALELIGQGRTSLPDGSISIGAARPTTPAPDPSKARGPCPGELREAEAGPPTPIGAERVWCAVAEPIDAMAQCQRHTDPSSNQTVLPARTLLVQFICGECCTVWIG